ncbi:MAG: glycerophosphodiester phosphodiesterase family protein [Pirellulales bacterium]
MPPHPADISVWRRLPRAFAVAWRPLLLYELLVSLLAATLLGPLLAAAIAWLVGLGGDTALGNWEVARFLATPAGLLAILLASTATLGLLFVEYSGLILLAHAALHGASPSIRQVAAAVVRSAPALFVVAALQTALALLIAMPFALLAFITYRVLLGQADINYYIDQRPPQFWIAAVIGLTLAVGLSLALLWLFARWTFTVPLIVVERQNWSDALRTSVLRMRGRTIPLLLVFAAWLVLRSAALLAAIYGLDRANHLLFAQLEEPLWLVVWSTLALLLFDAIVLQIIAALFAVAFGLLLAGEYVRRQPAGQDPATHPIVVESRPAHRPWKSAAAILALLAIGPLVNLAYALVLAERLFDDRVTLVTAHRAGPSDEPENSIAALRLALAAGADFAEIDVQLTADRHVVLLHDRDLRRVTGDPRNLAGVSLADLAPLRLRAGNRPTDSQIPTLAELIDASGDRLRLNIELKDFGHSQDLPAAVVEVLRERGFTGRAIVSSFEMSLLDETRRLQPDLPSGLIVSAIKGDITRLDVDFLSLNRRLVDAQLVRRAHQRGRQVHVWTVNDRETTLRMLDLGCDNLITSHPALVRQVVDEYAALGDAARVLLRLRRWMRE